MKSIILSILLAALCSESIATQGVDLTEKIIQWRQVDWAPFYIVEGKNKGRGLFDEVTNHLEKNLPEYQHRRVKMHNDRAKKIMVAGHNVCHPSMISQKPGIKLSIVSTLIFPHQIITRLDNKKFPHTEGGMSLSTLLKNQTLSAGFSFNPYPKAINGIINSDKGEPHVYGTPRYMSTIKMLLKKRFDYTVEYYISANYASSEIMGQKNLLA